MTQAARPNHPALAFLRKEWLLGVSVATSLVFLLRGDALFAGLANPLWLALVFAWLFAAVLGSAFCVVRHADRVAARLGEPYGTLILTLSVTSIEVMSIAAVMMHGNNPTFARDTLVSVVMIILNGMVGLSLLIGAWKHREQYYNLQGRACVSRRHHPADGAQPDPSHLHAEHARPHRLGRAGGRS